MTTECGDSPSQPKHHLKMSTVRGTEKHKYHVDDRLGHGATGNVFKGLSKDGKYHALKIFEPHAIKDITREIDALRKLKHENIIHFIGVERELISGQVVVVMEFCEGGSLASFLQEPDHFFGLPDTEFLQLLKHLVSGMEHLRSNGFIHRDIKPGNILRCINNDGLSIYKLSDFGTARPLEDDEFFKSLVGTEEYLHPDLFNAAFMSEGKSLRFPHSVDLWSLGATLYNAATGDIPFCPYLRRQDRTTMYDMITKKPVGVIGARQDRPNGEIQWLYELPDTSRMSGGLQTLITPLLVPLFEKDPRRGWTFEDFFQRTQTILGSENITVLTLFSYHSPFDTVYLPHLASVGDLKDVLTEHWNGNTVGLLDVLYGEGRLGDWLQDDDQLFDMPATDAASPLIALPSSLPKDLEKPTPELAMSKIMSDEVSFSERVSSTDVRKGREMCGIVALIDRRTADLAVFQQHLLKLRHKLRFQLKKEKQQAESTSNMITELFDVISGSADMSVWSEQEKINFKEVKDKMSSVTDSLHSACNTVKLPFEDNQWSFDGKKCMQQTRRAREEAEVWLKDICERKTAEKTRYATQHGHNCVLASRHRLERAYRRAVNLWSNQCFQKTTLLRDTFLNWYRSYLEASSGLQSCRENLTTVVSLVTQLFKSCVNRSQLSSLQTQKVSKSLLTKNPKVDSTELSSLKDMLQDLTANLETPEIFDLPSKSSV